MTSRIFTPRQEPPRHRTGAPQSPSTDAPTYSSIIPSRNKANAQNPDVDDINEDSPLLRARDSDDEPSPLKIVSDLEDDIWQEEEKETRSSGYLFLLTLGSLG
jgi:hypothetical protein